MDKKMIFLVITLILVVGVFGVFIFGSPQSISFMEDLIPERFSANSEQATIREVQLDNPGGNHIVLQQQFLGTWTIKQTGNESILYNVSVDKNEVTIKPAFDGSIIREECISIFDEKSNKSTEECKDVTYIQPNTLKATDNKLVNTQLTKDGRGDFVYTLDPDKSLYYKFGEESVILVADVGFVATSTNVTNEPGFSHLNLSIQNPMDDINFYFSFDTNESPTTVYDYTNFSEDGTYSGNSRFTELGKYGGGIILDGTGDFLTVNPNVDSDAFSMYFWIYVDSLPDAETVMVQYGDMVNVGFSLSAIQDNSTQFDAQMRLFPGPQVGNRCGNMGIDAWHHVGFTKWPGLQQYNIYVDGVSCTSGTMNTPGVTDAGDDFTIGGSSTGNDIVGRIDEFMYFDQAWFSITYQDDLFNENASRFADVGTMKFVDVNVSAVGGGTEDTLNITLTDYQALFGSNISVQVNDDDVFNLSADGTFTNYNFTEDPNFINLTFLFQNGNGSTQFYTPVIAGNITLDSWSSAPAGPSDDEFPIFDNFRDNNATHAGEYARFNVTIISTNGTVFLEIDEVNYTANNGSSTISNATEFNVTINLTSPGVFPYYWGSFGNGTDANSNITALRDFSVNATPGGDFELPIFDNFRDNNATHSGEFARFNVTIISTNGTVFLEIDEVNYTASNGSSTISNNTEFNVTINLTDPGDFNYYWGTWGNGTDTNFNLSALRGFSVNETPYFPIFSDFKDNNATHAGEYARFNVTVINTNGTVLFEIDEVNYTASNQSATSNPDVFNVTLNLTNSGVFPYVWNTGGNGTIFTANASVPIDFSVNQTPSAPTFSNFKVWAENSTDGIIPGEEGAFTTANLQAIEFARVNFTVTAGNVSNLDGDIKLFFTANGTNACSLGNNQSTRCYNITNAEPFKWIEFQNGTSTRTFKDEGASGDFITCDVFQSSAKQKNYSCLIDEHYNPNMFKWYDAGFNFSDIKWQGGASQRIRGNNMIQIGVNQTAIPLDADQYRLDFRVNVTVPAPTEALEAHLCNSSYISGSPDGNPSCVLIATKLPSELQDDATHFRGVFTKNEVDALGDIGSIILDTDQIGSASIYYELKTYKILAGTHTQMWNFSTTNGATWTKDTDGYESEFNINWFYDAIDATQTVFKVFAEGKGGIGANSSEFNFTWNIDPSQNYPPLVNIIVPEQSAIINLTIDINWTVSEPNDDNWTTNITITNDDTVNLTIAAAISQNTSTITWNTSALSNGIYNLTVTIFENSTTELFIVNDTHQVNISNFIDAQNPSITLLTEAPTDPENYSQGRKYVFNATITDDGALEGIIIEFNGVNFTIFTSGDPIPSDNIYNFTILDLAAAEYSYYWMANDTTGKRNVTATGDNLPSAYTVQQSTGDIELYLNNLTSNVTVSVNELVQINASSNDSQGIFQIEIDGVIISNGTNAVINSSTAEFPGSVNVTVTLFDSQNFTSDVQTRFIDVQDETFPLFSNFRDNNGTDGGDLARFNVTVINTNGTVFLEIEGTNFTASNETPGGNATEFNVSVNLTNAGVFPYYWGSFGNATATNLNVSSLIDFSVVSSGVQAPIIIITFPFEGGIYSGNRLALNVTSDIQINEWRWSLNLTTNDTTINNVTFTPNITIPIAETGLQTLYVFGNSTSNMWGNDSKTFTFVRIEQFEGITTIYIFVFLLGICFLLIGFTKDKYILRMAGGFIFAVLGLVIAKDRIIDTGSAFITNSIAWIFIGIGGYFMIKEPLEEYLRREK